MDRVVLVLLLLAASAYELWASESRPPHPVLLGVDTAGGYGYGKFGPNLLAHEPFAKALQELGAQMVVYHLFPVTDQGDDGPRLNAQRIAQIDRSMRARGLKYTLNNEQSNWNKWKYVEPGKNEFAHPDGTHRWDLRMEWLDPLLPPSAPGDPALLGITYDEPAHMQITSHQFATYPDNQPFDAPYLVNTDDMPLERAFDLLSGKCRRIRLEHYEGRVQPQTEQVWPDLFHIFARGGWTIAPKLLKESLSSVVMSVALGAALEYADSGTSLWVSPDLWHSGLYPGHSPRALRSALLMGYWLGADTVYVENVDWQQSDAWHPEAGPWSLLKWTDKDTYEITPYGRVFQGFAKDYVPKHPRTVHWRDYRPKIAIVRLPDGAWGQRGTMFRDRLLGNRSHPMDEASAEWLQVWPILTHGAVHAGAISYNNGNVYPEERYPFFIPIDSIAVFDHKVTGQVLDSVQCFVVCGHALSGPTFDDIRRRVAKGATCIISRRLYELRCKETLPGKWVIVDSFTDPKVEETLKPFLGPPDVARFEFADQIVEFHAVEDRDVVDVRVIPRKGDRR